MYTDSATSHTLLGIYAIVDSGSTTRGLRRSCDRKLCLIAINNIIIIAICKCLAYCTTERAIERQLHSSFNVDSLLKKI